MMNEEILKPVIIENTIIAGYFVSNLGNIYSCMVLNRLIDGTFINTIDLNQNKIIKPSKTSAGYLRVPIVFPKGLFGYKYMSSSKKTQRRYCSVHKLVIDAFKPFDQFLPDCINEKSYEKCDESIKILLRQLFLINHKDHNKENNHIDNLERVTPRENSHSAKIFYNGNTANACKSK